MDISRTYSIAVFYPSHIFLKLRMRGKVKNEEWNKIRVKLTILIRIPEAAFVVIN